MKPRRDHQRTGAQHRVQHAHQKTPDMGERGDRQPDLGLLGGPAPFHQVDHLAHRRIGVRDLLGQARGASGKQDRGDPGCPVRRRECRRARPLHEARHRSIVERRDGKPRDLPVRQDRRHIEPRQKRVNRCVGMRVVDQRRRRPGGKRGVVGHQKRRAVGQDKRHGAARNAGSQLVGQSPDRPCRLCIGQAAGRRGAIAAVRLGALCRVEQSKHRAGRTAIRGR